VVKKAQKQNFLSSKWRDYFVELIISILITTLFMSLMGTNVKWVAVIAIILFIFYTPVMIIWELFFDVGVPTFLLYQGTWMSSVYQLVFILLIFLQTYLVVHLIGYFWRKKKK